MFGELEAAPLSRTASPFGTGAHVLWDVVFGISENQPDATPSSQSHNLHASFQQGRSRAAASSGCKDRSLASC